MPLLRRLLRTLHATRRPVTDGTLTVAGLQAPVTIRRDGWHVPHIEASSTPDAWYGLGFCMGQDRGFQIELFTRLAAGRLSEMIGRDGLPIDRFTRRLGAHRQATKQWSTLREDRRTVLTAFTAGVNAGRTEGSPRRPIEFVLLRHHAEPLTAIDIAATLKLNGFLLSANWQTELARLLVLTLDGPEALADLDVLGLDDIPITSPPAATARAAASLADEVALLSWYVPTTGASNNWVIGGGRTATGRPLVANDPHMPAMLPCPWYLAHLTTPEWQAAGAALVGTPSIAAGHNGFAAWGTTSGHTDDSDLFLERLSPDGTKVRTGDGWEPTEMLNEVIRVRRGDDVTERVIVTPRGPIVSDVFDLDEDLDTVTGTPETSMAALSLAAVAMTDHGDVEGYLTVPEARSFDEFRHRFSRWPGLSFNVVWGDEDGHIGWQLVGELPVRRSGRGAFPLPGWDPAVGWEPERLPFDRMPHASDPDRGWLATANNQPTEQVDGLGVDFMEGWRVAAIGEGIEERDDWDVAGTFALQRDTRSLPWREVREPVLAIAPNDDRARVALDRLARWDGTMAPDSPAAAIFALFVASMTQRIVGARAPRAGAWLLGRSAVPDLLAHTLPGLIRVSHACRLLAEQPDGWFMEGWHAEIEAALVEAMTTITEHTADGADWATVRPVHLEHLVARSAAALAPVFNRGPIPIGGDSTTIPQAAVVASAPLDAPMGFPNMRMAVPTGDWSAARWALAGGQSGDPTSPHYDDQIGPWQTAGIPIPWGSDEVAAATVASLELQP